MKLAWLIVAVAGCHPAAGDDYPVLPGGDDTQGGGGIPRDAVTDDSTDASSTLAGRACLLTDLRDPGSCAATGAGGLTVTLGGETATTADDGTFTLARPVGSMLVWHVTGATIVPSVMPLDVTVTIPVIATTTYLDALDNNGILLAPGQGSVFVHVVRGGAAITGATAVASPPPTYAPFYDGSTSLVWDQDATGARGMVWVAGAEAGTLTVTVTPPLATAGTPLAVPIEGDSITFATLAIP